VDQRVNRVVATPTQTLLLRAAARRADGRVIPPDTLRGWMEDGDGGYLATC
jgi:hypothetical protein